MDTVREPNRNESEYPRVLIVGVTFDTVTGGGITLGNLFRGWPRDRLFVASVHPCVMIPPPCGRQYIIGRDEIQWISPLGRAVPGTRQLSVADWVAPPLPSASATEPAAVGVGARRLAERAARAGIDCLGGPDAVKSFQCSSGLTAWVRDAHPDLMYTQLASLSVMRLVAELARSLSLPTVVHIMDDWPSVIYRKGLLSPRLRKTTGRLFRGLVGGAAATLAISQPMADEYRRRYGRDWDVFHNPVDVARWSGRRRRDRSWEGVFKVVYAGRVGLGVESSIRDVCESVQTLGRRGLPIRLDVFTPDQAGAADLHLGSFDGVRVWGAVEDGRMPATLAAADLLVLPYDFHGRAARFACLSYPTKAPAYMATGVPTLVYAPRGHALAVDARETGWAYVVDKPDVGGLCTAIELLTEDLALRERLAETATTLCAARHDATAVRARFRSVLAAAARGRII